jgi:hypothetical protein
LFVCSANVAVDADVESEDSANLRVLTSADSAVLRAVSTATNEAVPELMVLESNDTD